MLYNTIYENGIYRWPDTYLGSEEFFSIDCGPYLEAEQDTMVSVSWEVPPELTELESFTLENEAFIQLRADTLGVHIINFELQSIEDDRIQLVQERVKIVVVEI